MTLEFDLSLLEQGDWITATFRDGDTELVTTGEVVCFNEMKTVVSTLFAKDLVRKGGKIHPYLFSVTRASRPIPEEPADGSFGILENGHKFVIKNRHLPAERHCMVIYSTEGRGWDWHHWADIYSRVTRIWDTNGNEVTL